MRIETYFHSPVTLALLLLALLAFDVLLRQLQVRRLRRRESDLARQLQEAEESRKSLDLKLMEADQALQRLGGELEEKTESLKKAKEMLEKLANLDSLTGVANRRSLEQFLSLEWRRASREGNPLSLIMVDIDCFQQYNESYGHHAGDECLKKVAAAIQMANRAGDMVSRFGGEEFLIVLTNTDPNGALMVAERMKAKVADLKIPHTCSLVDVHLTISCGVATMIPDSDSLFSEGIGRAEKALDQAKKGGRNRTALFSLPANN